MRSPSPRAPHRALVAIVSALALAGAWTGGAIRPAAADTGRTVPGPWDWRTYGHDAHHTFHGQTSLTEPLAPALSPAWTFPTGGAVTATPTVVDGSVYVGSWDGYFYAVALGTGKLRWKFQLTPQPAVPTDITSDGGLVTSSAWFEPGARRQGDQAGTNANDQAGTAGGNDQSGPGSTDDQAGRPDLVIFAGGYTLYALVATGPKAGQLYWSHDYTGLPEQPPSPTTDSTRIFSSPVVHQGRVIFGVSSDGGAGHRGYVVSADLNTGKPVWRFETDVDSSGRVLNDGCGGVWSSPTVDEARGLVVFGVADCNLQGTPPYNQRVLALHASDGSLAWVFTPPRLRGVPAGQDPPCDFDFGATANLNMPEEETGTSAFLGIGGKDGTYYSLEPRTGQLRWSTNVVFGGTAGGFIATTAYDGTRVYGSTALGDFGGGPPCDPSNPRDTPLQEPTVHAFDAQTGKLAWQASQGASFAPTTVAGGMTFNGLAGPHKVQIRDAATGTLLKELALSAPCWSGIATAGDAIVLGTGTAFSSQDGIVAFTPDGRPPSVPDGGTHQ